MRGNQDPWQLMFQQNTSAWDRRHYSSTSSALLEDLCKQQKSPSDDPGLVFCKQWSSLPSVVEVPSSTDAWEAPRCQLSVLSPPSPGSHLARARQQSSWVLFSYQQFWKCSVFTIWSLLERLFVFSLVGRYRRDHSYQRAFADKDGSSKEAVTHLFILVAETSRRKIVQTSRKKIAE